MSGQLILAADQRARGTITIERYPDYLSALSAALPACDGLVASAQPLRHLVASAAIAWDQRSYLSLNPTGLSGSVFELDDRMVASLDAAGAAGYTGVKLLSRIDLSDRITARTLEVLGRVVSDAQRLRIEVLIEPVSWSEGRIDRSTSAIVYASVVAHDLGAPVLVVPAPGDAPAGQARASGVARVVDSVGSPILFVVGETPGAAADPRSDLLAEVADVVAGGAAGVVVGPALYCDADPAFLARLVADIVRNEESLEEVLGKLSGLQGVDDSNT